MDNILCVDVKCDWKLIELNLIQCGEFFAGFEGMCLDKRCKKEHRSQCSFIQKMGSPKWMLDKSGWFEFSFQCSWI